MCVCLCAREFMCLCLLSVVYGCHRRRRRCYSIEQWGREQGKEREREKRNQQIITSNLFTCGNSIYTIGAENRTEHRTHSNSNERKRDQIASNEMDERETKIHNRNERTNEQTIQRKEVRKKKKKLKQIV